VRLADLGGLAALGFRLVPKKTLVRGVYRSIVEREDAISEARVEAYAAPLRRPEVQRAALEVARNLFGPEVESFTARYPDIDVPLLCLWGDRDPVVPTWVGQRLAAEVPGGRYVELERCGHQVTEECPKASLRHLLDFMAETGAG
jgi:pimeloyl-ACP methyl ester carboxylesterase